MALLSVTHKPVTGTARQFDGTLQAFLDIINGRPKSGLHADCRFNEAGDFISLTVAAPNGTVALNLGDWVVFPTDTTAPPLRLTNAEAIAAWQVT